LDLARHALECTTRFKLVQEQSFVTSMTSVVSSLDCGEANALIKSYPLFVCTSALQANNTRRYIRNERKTEEREGGGGHGGDENCQRRVNHDSR